MPGQPRRIVHPLLTLLVAVVAIATSVETARAARPWVAAVGAEDPLAAFIGADGATYLLEPDQTARRLTAYPTRAAGLAGVAVDPRAEVIATTRPVGIRSEVALVLVADGRARAVPGTRERNCGAPSFHPDGVHLLAVCDSSQDYSARTIELFEGDRGHVRTVARGGIGGIQFGIGGLLVSPDGQFVLLEEHLGDYAVRYWRVALDTGRVERFSVAGPENAVHLAAFLPDGRILATSCEYCGWLGPNPPPSPPHTEIVLVASDGTIDTILHSVTDMASSPALSPDQETLLYTTFSGDLPLLWRLTRSMGVAQQVGTGERPTYPQVSTLSSVGSLADVELQASPGRIGPPGPSGVWTVVLHGALSSEAEAAALARAATAAFPDAAVLFSTDYPNLRPGFWLVYAGQYSSDTAASDSAQRARDVGYPGAYPRWLGAQRQ